VIKEVQYESEEDREFVRGLLERHGYVYGISVEEFLSQWETGQVRTWVAFQDGKAVGAIHAQYHELENGIVECEGHFAFDHQGIRIAYESTVCAMHCIKGTPLVGRIKPSNLLAIRFAERLGFVEVDRTNEYVELQGVA
jgi:hypothetical protein